MPPFPAFAFLLVLLLACQPNEGARYARRGSFPVGTREVVIPGKDAAPSLPATLWYPALKPAGAREEIIYQGATEGIGASGQSAPIRGRALADAAPVATGGAHPLVVFVSGRDRGRMLYASILEHLASHGFVVLAMGPVVGLAHPVLRLRTVTRAIDFAESLGGSFTGLIDGSRTAVAGHGDGALVALLAGGARMDLAAAAALCASSYPHTDECDRWLTPQGRLAFATTADLQREPERGLYPSYGDPRVKALVPMGLGGELETSSELSALTLPVLIITGSQDRERPVSGAERIYQNLPSPLKAKLVFLGGGHDLFCVAKDDIAVATDTTGLDPGRWDTRRTHDLINHVTTAFLLDVLRGDQAAHKALLPEAVTFQEIQYTATWK